MQDDRWISNLKPKLKRFVIEYFLIMQMWQYDIDTFPDDAYDEARKYFGEKEIADLTLAVITINGWNRLVISFREGTSNKHRFDQ